jgi:hypothetical protein
MYLVAMRTSELAPWGLLEPFQPNSWTLTSFIIHVVTGSYNIAYSNAFEIQFQREDSLSSSFDLCYPLPDTFSFGYDYSYPLFQPEI